MFRLFLHAFILAATIGIAHSQDALNCTMLGATEGACRAVAQLGNLVFLGSGATVITLDIHDPGPAIKLSACPMPDEVTDIAIQGDIAYVAATHFICLVDIHDVVHPRQIGQWYTPGYIHELNAIGSLVYLSDGLSFKILDCDDHENLQVVGEFDPQDSIWYFDVQDDLVAINHSNEFTLLDVSNPEEPLVLGSYVGLSYTPRIALHDSLLYSADPINGIHVYDISIADQIEEVGSYQLSGSVLNFKYYSGKLLWGDFNALHVFDVSNPIQPILAGQIQCPSSAWGFCALNQRICIADYREGLIAAEIDDPTNPVVWGTYEIDGLAYASIPSDGIACVAGVTGIDVYNTTVNGCYEKLDYLRTTGLPIGIAVQDSYAYLPVLNEGLWVVDIHDPEQLQEVGFIETEGNFLAVTTAGNLAYTSTYPPGIEIYDISNPVLPQLLGRVESAAQVRDIAVDGNWAYLAESDSALITINVSDPAHPIAVGRLDLPGQAKSVAVDGGRALVAADQNGLHFIDIADPAHPHEQYIYTANPYNEAVAIQGDLAFVAANSNGLRVLDISDPLNVNEVGFFETPGNATDVQVVDRVAYVATHSGGVVAIEFDPDADLYPGNPSIPISTALMTNFPNPFNPATRISYRVPTTGHVTIEIFNLAGELVQTLVNKSLAAGEHHIVFDGSSSASGIYIAHLTTDQNSIVNKMLLLK
ncbi:MAG: T9SS type A sorting domain-containing protein [Candidatus Delongbacteria bacterium]